MSFLKRCKKYEGGFTMAELGFVIVIAGIIMVPIYSIIFYITQIGPDEKRFEVIQRGLAEHLRVTGTLPCPADPTADLDDGAVSYQADCGGVTSVGGVYIGAVPVENLRAALGCADLGILNVTADVLTSLRNKLLGLREIFTDGADADGNTYNVDDSLCVPRDYILDEFGNKFIYAVSIDATSPGFNMFTTGGNVVVEDEAGIIVDDKQIYVLVSTGKDGKGAYQRDGTRRGVDCGDRPGLDNENCNEDRTFVAATQANVEGNRFYDDKIDYGIAGFFTEESFWQWGDADMPSGGRDMILNTGTRLLLDPMGTPDLNDALYVNSGGADIKTNLRVEDGGAGGNVNSGNTVEVNEKANAVPEAGVGGNVEAPKFCYDPPLTSGC